MNKRISSMLWLVILLTGGALAVSVISFQVGRQNPLPITDSPGATAGNGACEFGETATSVPADCGSPKPITPNCPEPKKTITYDTDKHKGKYDNLQWTPWQNTANVSMGDKILMKFSIDGIKYQMETEFKHDINTNDFGNDRLFSYWVYPDGTTVYGPIIVYVCERGGAYIAVPDPSLQIDQPTGPQA